MKKLGAAIIGCGAIYNTHSDVLLQNDLAQINAVVDIDEEKAKKAAEKCNCKYFTDYKEMLKDESIEVVHVCTPHYLHASMAIDAIKAGKNVLIEKPVAMNEVEALEIVTVAKEYNKQVAVCFQNRYNFNSIKAKEIIVSGELGNIKAIKGIVTWHRSEPYYTESGWRGKWATEGGGVLINQAIHTLDLMQWLGGPIIELKGNVDTRTLNNIIEVEDTAEATFYYQNGAIGLFYATNSYSTDSPIELEIQCEKGSIRIIEDQLLLKTDKGVELFKDENALKPQYKSYWGMSHSKLINAFYKSITEENSLGYIKAEEGINALKLIQGIYKSSSSKEKVSISVDS